MHLISVLYEGTKIRDVSPSGVSEEAETEDESTDFSVPLLLRLEWTRLDFVEPSRVCTLVDDDVNGLRTFRNILKKSELRARLQTESGVGKLRVSGEVESLELRLVMVFDDVAGKRHSGLHYV